MSENNSTRKLDVGFWNKPDGARWVYADLIKWGEPGRRPRWIPSFLDLHRIIQAIAECEDERYPPPEFAGRGRLVSFLKDAVYESDFGKLAQKYKIPERDGDQVVNTNGAKVRGIALTPEAAVPPVKGPQQVLDHLLACGHFPRYREFDGSCWICNRGK